MSCQEAPGNRTRRSLTNAPRFSQLIARERPGTIARTRIGLHARPGHSPADLATKPTQLSLHSIQLDTRNTDHLRRFHAHWWLPPSGRRSRYAGQITRATLARIFVRARCVPDGAVSDGASRVITVIAEHVLTWTVPVQRVGPQPSKLVMRVRLPSPAPPRKPRSGHLRAASQALLARPRGVQLQLLGTIPPELVRLRSR